jgi:TolA-binding protein
MGLFNFKKNRGVVDLGERYRKQQEKVAEMKEEVAVASGESSTPIGGVFPFFAGNASSTSSVNNSTPSNISNSGIDAAERRRRLVKRLKDMTSQIEEMSNQIYKLQQRVEVLERKI